jgi:hypothetical protein
MTPSEEPTRCARCDYLENAHTPEGRTLWKEMFADDTINPGAICSEFVPAPPKEVR